MVTIFLEKCWRLFWYTVLGWWKKNSFNSKIIIVEIIDYTIYTKHSLIPNTRPWKNILVWDWDIIIDYDVVNQVYDDVVGKLHRYIYLVNYVHVKFRVTPWFKV